MTKGYILNNKTILITQIRLHDYAGSEIVTYELAKYFSSQGSNVIIATHTYGGVIKGDIDRLKNVKVIVSNERRFNKYIREADIDIVWVHHQYVPEVLLKKENIHYIYHHMSPYAELESPLFWRIEQSLADVILFNSPETMNRFTSDGYFENSLNRLAVFGNPAPVEFFQPDSLNNPKPLRILVVSNHPPVEVEGAVTLLASQGISVNHFGSSSNGRPLLVSPQHVSDVDVVITIGKTVQYSLAAGTPVYCYDHFGGPGYLSWSNFSKSREYNFSGRGYRKKSTEKISAEILKNYDKAREFAEYAKKNIASEYRLDNAVEKVMIMLSESKKLANKPSLSKLDFTAYLNNMRIIERNVRGTTELQSATNQLLESKLSDFSSENERLKQEYNIAKKEIDNISQSNAFRIGQIIIKPFAKTKKYFKKIV
jgi:hypothetical protein